MAETNLYFSRDTKLYLGKGAFFWEIPVLDGFSFNQSTNTSEVTLSEMVSSTGTSRRGRKIFTDSYAPAEWSFSTYVRPFATTATALGANTVVSIHAVEEALWANMIGLGTYAARPSAVGANIPYPGFTTAADSSQVAFTESNKSSLGEMDLYFVMGGSSQSIHTTTLGAVATATDTITLAVATDQIEPGDVVIIGDQTNDGSAITVKTVTSTTEIVLSDPITATNASAITFSRAVCYKLEKAVVNEASIDFDIDGIATINWSGMANIIKETVSPVVNTAASTTTAAAAAANVSIITVTNNTGITVGDILTSTNDSSAIVTAISTNTITLSKNVTFANGSQLIFTGNLCNEGAFKTDNFIRNRLTSLACVSTLPTADTYTMTLTGGNITISNNLTFLTPETIGVVSQPFAHVTGTRTVGGNFTCYLTTGDNGSAELFDTLLGATTTITNKFDLEFNIGGTTGPRLQAKMSNCHLELPSHNIDDVIALETNFHALPSTIGGTDEIVLTYAV